MLAFPAGCGLTSVLHVMVVFLVFNGQVRLAAQGSKSEQTRPRARDRRDAGWLQARGVGGQLDRGSVGSVG